MRIHITQSPAWTGKKVSKKACKAAERELARKLGFILSVMAGRRMPRNMEELDKLLREASTAPEPQAELMRDSEAAASEATAGQPDYTGALTINYIFG